MDQPAFELAQAYSDRMRRLIEAMAEPFQPDTVNVLAAHAFVLGGEAGGGERAAHLVEEYAVPARHSRPAPDTWHSDTSTGPSAFPAAAACTTAARRCNWTSARPSTTKQVNVVELEPGIPARVEAVRLAAGRRLRTVVGNVDELAAVASDAADDDWIRVIVRDAARAGLAAEIRELVRPRAVDVRIESTVVAEARDGTDHRSRSPQELFDDFLAERGEGDPRLRGPLRRPPRRGARAGRAMRPLTLSVEGFGAFRQRVDVDFADAELLALVGPTGAGKSTIIDAITFALYGSVVRYDDNRAVAPVINQTAPQARVQLDFELGGRTYRAVRVVRRTKQGGATTPEARLERGDEVLAADARGMTTAVTDLLALDVEHFNKTVVLPQGRFAEFLHDRPAERQATLRRLLDLGLYERMGRAARQRGTTARAQLEAYTADLGQLERQLTDERRAALGGASRPVGRRPCRRRPSRRRRRATRRRAPGARRPAGRARSRPHAARWRPRTGRPGRPRRGPARGGR